MKNKNIKILVDNNCPYCKGKGIIWVMVGDEPEKDVCSCVTIINKGEKMTNKEYEVALELGRKNLAYDILKLTLRWDGKNDNDVLCDIREYCNEIIKINY